MYTTDSCQLTTKDFTILEVVRDRHPMRDEAFWALLPRGRRANARYIRTMVAHIVFQTKTPI